MPPSLRGGFEEIDRYLSPGIIVSYGSCLRDGSFRKSVFLYNSTRYSSPFCFRGVFFRKIGAADERYVIRPSTDAGKKYLVDQSAKRRGFIWKRLVDLTRAVRVTLSLTRALWLHKRAKPSYPHRCPCFHCLDLNSQLPGGSSP